MPLVQAKCTNCGGVLQIESGKDAAICPYCQAAFIVEKAINNFNTTNNISNSNVYIYNNVGADSEDDIVKKKIETLKVFYDNENTEKALKDLKDLTLKYPGNEMVLDTYKELFIRTRDSKDYKSAADLCVFMNEKLPKKYYYWQELLKIKYKQILSNRSFLSNHDTKNSTDVFRTDLSNAVNDLLELQKKAEKYCPDNKKDKLKSIEDSFYTNVYNDAKMGHFQILAALYFSKETIKLNPLMKQLGEEARAVSDNLKRMLVHYGMENDYMYHQFGNTKYGKFSFWRTYEGHYASHVEFLNPMIIGNECIVQILDHVKGNKEERCVNIDLTASDSDSFYKRVGEIVTENTNNSAGCPLCGGKLDLYKKMQSFKTIKGRICNKCHIRIVDGEVTFE